MLFKKIILCLSILSFTHLAHAEATELDQYFINKQIIDSAYKIRNPVALNEILTAMSDEDSRTMPYQVDQNTLIEKLRLYSDHIDIQGIITTADFSQFAADIGDKAIKKLIKDNLIQNCALLFEHEFQRVNPYYVQVHLSATDKSYAIKIKNSQCQF